MITSETWIPAAHQRLRQAFEMFSGAADKLSHAYRELQNEVMRLRGELAAANDELRRQLAEKAELSRRLEALLDALPGGVVALDANGVIEDFNRAAEKILGAPLLGQPWGQIVGGRLSATGDPGEWTLCCAAPGAAQRLRIESSAPDPEGRRILLIHDITEMHLMQERLRRSQRLSAMGEVAARLAHCLRTPLATALLYCSHLADPGLAEDQRAGFVARALDRLRHLERLIRDTLLFVKGGTADCERVELSSLLEELRQVMEPQMSRRAVRFEVHDRSSGAAVRADRRALQAAVMSLLENALQACPGGGSVSLECSWHAEGLALAVRDSGPGIEPDLRDRIFEPFFTTRAGGTGLGLAIVRGVAESLGGSVQVNSVPGQGSEFVLLLPHELRNGAQWA